MSRPYRQNVVAVIQDGKGRYLVGERSDTPNAWQFPQGGIDAGESAEQALLREIHEELGVAHITILRKGSHRVCYDFPQEVAQEKIAQKYRGQEQWWFLCQLPHEQSPNLAQSDGEFSQFAWRDLKDIVAGIIAWKRQAYIDGLNSLGLKIS